MNFGFAPIIFGLTAALTWGAGDFSGGVATKKTSAYGVVIFAHIFSMVILLGAAFILREPIPPVESWFSLSRSLSIRRSACLNGGIAGSAVCRICSEVAGGHWNRSRVEQPDMQCRVL